MRKKKNLQKQKRLLAKLYPSTFAFSKQIIICTLSLCERKGSKYSLLLKPFAHTRKRKHSFGLNTFHLTMKV